VREILQLVMQQLGRLTVLGPRWALAA